MSAILDAVRQKYPVYAQVPDDQLALAIGNKYPSYLDHPEFKSEFETARTNAAKGVKLDPYQQAVMQAGGKMDDGGNSDDFLRSVANDPVGFLKSLPEAAFTVAATPGKLAYLGAADVLSKAFNQPEYGGNLSGEGPGVDKFVAGAAATNPKLALATKLAEDAPELASMMAVNPAGTAGRLLAAGFSADMVMKAKPLFEAYAEESNKPADQQDAGKLNELKAGLVQTFVMAPLAGHGATKDIPTLGALVERFVPRGQGIAPTKVDAADLQAAMRGNQLAPKPDNGGRPQGPPVSVSPQDLTPAIMVKGQPVTMPEATDHAGVVAAVKADPNLPPGLVKATEAAAVNDANHVFVTPDHQVLTREQAAKALGEIEPLHSEKLNELKSATETPSTPSGEGETTATQLLPVEVSDAEIKAAGQSIGVEPPPDVLDELEQITGGPVKLDPKQFGNLVQDARQQTFNAKGKATAATKRLDARLSASDGTPADEVLKGLAEQNPKYADWTPDQLAQAVIDAHARREAPAGDAALARQLAEEQKRTELWQADTAPAKDKVPLPPQETLLGDTFTVNGRPMRVVEHPVDVETGKPYGVIVEGAYGRQLVPVGQAIHIDRGSLRTATEETPGRVAASGTSAPRQAKISPALKYLRDNYDDIDPAEAATFDKEVTAATPDIRKLVEKLNDVTERLGEAIQERNAAPRDERLSESEFMREVYSPLLDEGDAAVAVFKAKHPDLEVSHKWSNSTMFSESNYLNIDSSTGYNVLEDFRISRHINHERAGKGTLENLPDFLKENAPESEASRTIAGSLKNAANQIQTESTMVKGGANTPQPAVDVKGRVAASGTSAPRVDKGGKTGGVNAENPAGSPKPSVQPPTSREAEFPKPLVGKIEKEVGNNVGEFYGSTSQDQFLSPQGRLAVESGNSHFPLVNWVQSSQKGNGRPLILSALKSFKADGRSGLSISTASEPEAIGAFRSLARRGFVKLTEAFVEDRPDEGLPNDKYIVYEAEITPAGEQFLKANASPKAGVAWNQGKAENISYVDAANKPTSRIADKQSSPQPAGDVKGRVAASGTSAPKPAAVKQSLQPPPPVANTPAPKSGPLAALQTSFLKTFAPHRLDAGALTVANILRDVNGEKAVKLAQADEAMHEWRTEFNKTPVRADWKYDPTQPLPHNYAIIDALETNRAGLPPRYQQLAQYFDQAFAERIKVIQQFAPNALQKLITNYFPHIWKDPQRAEGVMQQVATKLLAGRKEFLKQRTLPLFRDGLERGLQPVSDNPVDLLLAKLHSMDKFIAWLKASAEYKAIGELKFKYALEEMPEGWRVPAKGDPAFQVMAPPEVTLKEAFDAQLRTRTLELLQKLGVPEKRLASLGGKRWGMAYERPEQIKTRFAGPMSVYWHELGHILDYRYNLQNNFLKQGKQFDSELRALADQRAPANAPKTRAVYNKAKGKVENRPTSFIAYVRKAEEKMAVMSEAYVHAPEVFRRVAPSVYAAFDKFIEDHPELHDIRNLKPSLRLGVETTTQRLPGTLKLGEWIMRDGPAQVVENYLSPGLANSAVYRSIRAGSNLLNAAQLGLSAFHVGFTSLDAAISTATTGLVRASRGDLKGGARSLVTSPLAPVLNYYSGKAIQRAMLDPNTKSIRALNFGVGKYRLPGIEMPISQAAHDYAALAVKAGLRATVDPFWQTHFTRNLMRSIHEGGLAWAKTPLQAPMAAVEQMMRPIAEYLVPRQKLGVFAQIAKAEMERVGPAADIQTVRAAMAKAADYTEDRMGQMTYENLFYNKVAKDLALIAFRAYGWQLGKYRHLAGAIADTGATAKALTQGKLELSHRQLYFVALTATVAAVGGILHKLFTGQNPQTAMDYFHPSTGQVDAGGNPKRLSLPTYMKDLESDWHGLSKGIAEGGAIGGARGVWDATYHRLNPAVSEVVDLLNNKDFYGTQIYNPDDPQWTRLAQQAAFIAKGFEPFSISNTKKLNEGEASFRDKALPFFGVVPASKILTMTPLESYYSEQFRNLQPSGARTPEQAEQIKARAKLETDLRAAARSGKTPDSVPDLHARLLAAGVKTPQAADRLVQKAEWLPVQYQAHYLPLVQAMRGFDLGSEAEKRALAPVLQQRVNAAYQRRYNPLDDATAHRYAQQLIPYLKPLPAAPAVQTNGLRMLK